MLGAARPKSSAYPHPSPQWMPELDVRGVILCSGVSGNMSASWALGRVIWLALSSYTHSEVHSSGGEEPQGEAVTEEDQEACSIANGSRDAKAGREKSGNREVRPARRS